MDLMNVIEGAGKFATDYVRRLADLLAMPVNAAARRRTLKDTSFQPRFWAFVAISIFAGTILGRLALIQPESDWAVSYVVVIVFWFFASGWAFGVARVLGTKVSFEHALISSFYVLSVSFLVANLGALVAATLARIHILDPKTSDFVAVYTYMALQLLIVGAYYPAFLDLRGLGRWRIGILILLVPFPFVLSGIGIGLMEIASYAVRDMPLPGR